MPHDPHYRYLQHHPLNARDSFGLLAKNGWSLVIHCWRCKRETVRDGLELAAAFGEFATIGSIYRKLKCEGCGADLPTVDTVEPI